MARDLAAGGLADGAALFVATDGPTATGAILDHLTPAADADVALVVSVGDEAAAAADAAAFGTVGDLVHIVVGVESAPTRLMSSLEAHAAPTDTVDDPGDLGAVGQSVNRHLTDRIRDGHRPVVIVNSVTKLLRHNTAERVFYFMHLLLGIVDRRDGVALFTYDIAQHDTHELSTLAELADAVAATPGIDADVAADLHLPEPSRGDRVVNRLVAFSPALWILAVLTFGMTDIVTTYIGLSYGLAYEASPLAAAIFDDHRFGYIYIAKGAVFLLFFLIWRFIPTPYNVSVPLGLFLVGTAITIWNTHVILSGLL